MKKGVIVSHNGQKCGVWQFGYNLYNILKPSDQINWSYLEFSNFNDCINTLRSLDADYVIFNHHPATMPWLGNWQQTILPFNISTALRDLRAKKFKVLHLINQEIADTATIYPYDHLLCLDPTIIVQRPGVISAPRFIPVEPCNPDSNPEVFTVGSFGFATYAKGFDRLCALVNKQFDEAVIRLNIPSHDFEPDQTIKSTIEACEKEITKPGIRLEVSHAFLENEDLVDFLSKNTINAFLYLDTPGSGISSCADFALAAGRPVAFTKTSMFKNFFDVEPSVFVEDISLAGLAANGSNHLSEKRHQISPSNARVVWTHLITNAN